MRELCVCSALIAGLVVGAVVGVLATKRLWPWRQQAAVKSAAASDSETHHDTDSIKLVSSQHPPAGSSDRSDYSSFPTGAVR